VELALRLEPKDARVQRRYREFAELVEALPETRFDSSPALPMTASSEVPPSDVSEE
jgi:hypothetical protein